jgi:membrane-bound ClpP family serine protease
MVFILLIIGLVLVYLEFYLPGAVMGTAGALLLIASLFFFMMQYQSTPLTLLYLAFILGALAAVIKYALWKIPRSKPDSSIYSKDSQNGYFASSFDPAMIGKKGVVVTDLKPGGYILIDGVQAQALSESGYLTQGTEVIVLRGDGDSLIVKQSNEKG